MAAAPTVHTKFQVCGIEHLPLLNSSKGWVLYFKSCLPHHPNILILKYENADYMHASDLAILHERSGYRTKEKSRKNQHYEI